MTVRTSLRFIDWVRRRAMADRPVKSSEHNTRTENEIIKTVNEAVKLEKWFGEQYMKDNHPVEGTDVGRDRSAS